MAVIQRISAWGRGEGGSLKFKASAREGGKKGNLTDFEHDDEHGCRCQTSCCSVFHKRRISLDFFFNHVKTISRSPKKILNRCSLGEKCRYLCISVATTLVFHVKSFYTSGLANTENSMGVTDGTTNKGKLGFSVNNVHFPHFGIITYL